MKKNYVKTLPNTHKYPNYFPIFNILRYEKAKYIKMLAKFEFHHKFTCSNSTTLVVNLRNIIIRIKHLLIHHLFSPTETLANYQ